MKSALPLVLGLGGLGATGLLIASALREVTPPSGAASPARRVQADLEAGRLVWPLPEVPRRITGRFGDRRNNDKGSYVHQGLDLDGPRGARVVCVGNGVVERVDRDGVGKGVWNGNAVHVRIGAWRWSFLHLDRVDVAEGAEVGAGQQLGTVGNTGHSLAGRGGDGTHLHVHLTNRAGQPVDPLPVLEAEVPMLAGEADVDWLSAEHIEGTVEGLFETARGRPYVYGGGHANARFPEGARGLLSPPRLGWDCSGLTLALLAALGLIPWDWAGPRTSGDLRKLLAPVVRGQQRPGDIAAYPGHLAMVATWPDGRLDSVVIEAGPGGSKVNGDDPRSFVRAKSSIDYRSDLLLIGRMPALGVSPLQAETVRALHALLNGVHPGALSAPAAAELGRRYGGVPAVAALLRGGGTV